MTLHRVSDAYTPGRDAAAIMLEIVSQRVATCFFSCICLRLITASDCNLPRAFCGKQPHKSQKHHVPWVLVPRQRQKNTFHISHLGYVHAREAFISPKRIEILNVVFFVHDTHACVALAQMSRGPVEATFWVYSDFMNYQKGVYIRSKGAALLGGHAVKVRWSPLPALVPFPPGLSHCGRECEYFLSEPPSAARSSGGGFLKRVCPIGGW